MIVLTGEIKKSWHGKSFYLDIPADTISHELFMYLGGNLGLLTEDIIKMRKQVYNLDTSEKLKQFPTNVKGNHYEYKTGLCTFYGDSLQDFKNWFALHSEHIKYHKEIK